MELIDRSAHLSPVRPANSASVSRECEQDPFTVLNDTSFLRGVPASKLLANFGALLRNPAIGSQFDMNLNEGEALYATSHEVDSIDWFISHSWRDGRWQKYIAISWQLNHKFALVSANALSAAWALATYMGMPMPIQERFYQVSVGGQISRNEYTAGCIEIVYASSFIISLFSRRTNCLRRMHDPFLFLDKACIHQTDGRRKAQGISNLGGFLRESRRMLVLWSPDYFDRLWCNYEIACFTGLKGLENVVVVPLSMPIFVTCWFALGASVETLSHIQGSCKEPSFVAWVVIWAVWAIQRAAGVFTAICFVRTSRMRMELRKQLASFNWDQARSFCCDVGHTLPGTGARIPCDRLFIENNINRWYTELAESGENGLQWFERRIREHLGRKVRRLLGPLIIPRIVFVAHLSCTLWKAVELSIHNNTGLAFFFIFTIVEPVTFIFAYAWNGILGYGFLRVGARYPLVQDAFTGLLILLSHHKLLDAVMSFSYLLEQTHMMALLFEYFCVVLIALHVGRISP